MQDLSSLKRNLERLESSGNYRLQSQGIILLITQVREYVKQIAEEEAAVKQIHELDKIIRSKPETPEDETKIREAKQALQTAESIKRNITTKKASLRQLANEVGDLLKEIHKLV